MFAGVLATLLSVPVYLNPFQYSTKLVAEDYEEVNLWENWYKMG